MTKQELLQIAYKEYPVGTKYYPKLSDYKECTVKAKTFVYYDAYNHAGPSGPRITDGCGGYVYVNGEWSSKNIELDRVRKIIYSND